MENGKWKRKEPRALVPILRLRFIASIVAVRSHVEFGHSHMKVCRGDFGQRSKLYGLGVPRRNSEYGLTFF